MKNFFLAIYISFFLFTTASVSWAEPSFFIQTLTNNFIDWFFDKVDGYITNETSEEEMKQEKEVSPEKVQPKKNQPETERISEKNLVMRNDLYYKKFDGNSLQDLIWNWINGSGTTKYINNKSRLKKDKLCLRNLKTQTLIHLSRMKKLV